MEIAPKGQMRAFPGFHGRIYIVGEAPGRSEEQVGLPFVGSSGKLLMQMLAQVGIYRNNVRIGNTCWIRPPGNDLSKVPEPIKAHYADALRKDIVAQKPDLILAVGAEALKRLTGLEPISAYRGTIVMMEDIPVLPIYHPAAILRNWDMHWTTQQDIRKAASISLTGPPPPPPEDFRLRCSPDEFISILESIPDGSPVALDIETIPSAHVVTYVGLSWEKHKAANICLVTHPPEAIVTVLESLERLAARTELICHNAVYDMTWLYMFLHTYCPTKWDTMAMHHTLMPEGEKSLRYCASIYLTLPAWKQEAAGDIALYNARDCANTLLLWHVLKDRLETEGLMPFYLSFAQVRKEPCMFMTCRGLNVDQEARDRLLSETQRALESYETLLMAYGINPGSPAQLASLLYDKFRLPIQRNKHTRKPSVDKNAIKKLQRVASGEAKVFLHAYQEWKRLRDSISKDIGITPDPYTGRVHTGFNTEGTETGRMSTSSNPWGSGTNLQNRQKKFRNIFIPHKDDHVFVACDAVQAEAYVVAWLSDDEELIRTFLEGKDLHTYTAAQMFGIPEEAVTKEQRTIGKRIRHACNYSMSKVTLAEIMDVSQAEAAGLIERYHMTNPALRSNYFPKIEEAIRRRGFLVTPLGRRRIFTGRITDAKTMREAFAFIPQSTVGDLTIKALCDFYYHFKDDPEISIALQIHDENVFEAPIRKARQCALVMKELMERKMEVTSVTGKTRDLVIPCDFKIGYNLAPASDENPRGLRTWDPTTQEPEDVL